MSRSAMSSRTWYTQPVRLAIAGGQRPLATMAAALPIPTFQPALAQGVVFLAR